ncbi:malectin-like domain (MLD)- and leucine-rich repeat (LRR)-containing protein 4 [Hibiscus trionum]|uniref:Malectin-like domain (MLD)- and leucine-rich repeat (LRR)-containing protein 4 n=1 Tax=Hibiscus trionum TaxID=183268 RepID=A0A9W7IZH0_HIBTR|nr:malectin-like domain (MLD)- and leucine-rich repeat (LRR)-containing protein 4 [Hibiscus trionum]
MSLSIFLLWIVSIPLLVHSDTAQPRGLLISCGSSQKQTMPETNLTYIPDDGFVFVGNKTSLNQTGLLPILSTLRYFPQRSARKFCYTFQVVKGGKYLVRTIYYYGGFDGGKEPPVFDQIVGGTKWSTVNTTEDYANGLSSYYEIIVGAHLKTLSVCLARNGHTAKNSSPFISAIELLTLEDSMYNATDFNRLALVTVARSSFGSEDSISFPDDPYYRFWQPFTGKNEVVSSQTKVATSEFWNKPPEVIFTKAIAAGAGKKLELTWPPGSLPATKYHISLYFQDNRTAGADAWRGFNVTINGKAFYNNLKVSTGGVCIYSPGWPLSGQTQISLIPDAKSSVGPLINAGEIYQILPFGRRTLTREVGVMEELARSFDNPPADWAGDPCLPKANSWTGVTCFEKDMVTRIISVDLRNAGISGTLTPSINNLTLLHHLWLGGNNISGPIPDLSSLQLLETLHLENNSFTGKIPESLGRLPNLREVFLENNDLEGSIPSNLVDKKGLTLQVSPGNSLST